MSERGLKPVQLAFACGGDRSGALRLLGARGAERLSRPFSYELHLVHDDGALGDDQVDALFTAPCAIALGDGPGDVVRGVLAGLRALDATRERDGAHYVATLVPTMSLLGLGRANRVFQGLTTPEIVAAVFAGYSLTPERDYRIVTRANHPRREYVAQYAESDWDFVQRRLEHDGLYYWFEHQGLNDVMVIADGGHASPPIAHPTGLRYRGRNTLDAGDEHSISGWEVQYGRSPARVVVQDYNYRTPLLRLVGKADVGGAGGFGTETRYGEHFKDPAEGAALAKLRAELAACSRRVVSAASDSPRLRVGHWFELLDPPNPADAGKYLVTEIDHTVGELLGEPPVRGSTRMRALRFDTPFRPALETPLPRIHGVVTGHVAGEGKGQFAEIDEHGRYKVRLAFDAAPTRGLGVSRWIRMAQPHAGPGYGSHHPIHRGVEVLVTFVDGDPDRPIIVGAAPNPITKSPSTSQNATQSVLRTASGIHLELEDLATAGTTAAGGKR